MTSDWEVAGSNTSRYTHCPEVFHDFTQFLQVNSGSEPYVISQSLSLNSSFTVIVIILSQVTCSVVEGSA